MKGIVQKRDLWSKLGGGGENRITSRKGKKTYGEGGTPNLNGIQKSLAILQSNEIEKQSSLTELNIVFRPRVEAGGGGPGLRGNSV